jgi:Flp pilus assembly protein TadG
LLRRAGLAAGAATVRKQVFARNWADRLRDARTIRSFSVMLEQLKTKLVTGAKRLRGTATLRRLARHEDGQAAIEFAMVAAPFLGLLFAILEVSLVFFAGQTLETATADSSRLIMTGQAQSQNFTATEFKNAVCSRVYALFDCANGLKVDVRTAASFNSTNMSKPIDANGNVDNNFMFDAGKPGCIVVVRVMYEWPVIVPLLGFNLADMAGNKRLLMATAAFVNEPYGPSGCP